MGVATNFAHLLPRSRDPTAPSTPLLPAQGFASAPSGHRDLCPAPWPALGTCGCFKAGDSSSPGTRVGPGLSAVGRSCSVLHGLDERQYPERGAEQVVDGHTYGAATTLQPHKTSLRHPQTPTAHTAPKGEGKRQGLAPQLLCRGRGQQASLMTHFHPRETAQHLRWGRSMKSLGFA